MIAIKRVLARQLAEEMKQKKITKTRDSNKNVDESNATRSPIGSWKNRCFDWYDSTGSVGGGSSIANWFEIWIEAILEMVIACFLDNEALCFAECKLERGQQFDLLQ
jgi:hypothetical protein